MSWAIGAIASVLQIRASVKSMEGVLMMLRGMVTPWVRKTSSMVLRKSAPGGWKTQS
ncbi:hypothetical protein D3C87_1848550 [compost metagenome]